MFKKFFNLDGLKKKEEDIPFIENHIEKHIKEHIEGINRIEKEMLDQIGIPEDKIGYEKPMTPEQKKEIEAIKKPRNE